MKTLRFLLLTIILPFILSSCQTNKNLITGSKPTFALAIHGGAGYITEERFTKEKITEYKNKLKEALSAGYKILNEGGSSVDAVENVIKVMEDSPLFNAGKGAVLTELGDVELDASIMNGENINAGGVAGIKHIKNPITLARLVMEKSPHVLMFGNGAEKFAEEFSLPKVNNNYFKTEERLKQFYKDKKHSGTNKHYKFGTVGCVALDKNGNLAGGTSTGGMSGKKYGRVGDSPIIGAGTYANNKTCAISATGHGEYFIRNVVAYDISALMQYKGLSLKEAAESVIQHKLKKQNASGGIIGIDSEGNIIITFNTKGMFRGFVKENGKPVIGLFE